MIRLALAVMAAFLLAAAPARAQSCAVSRVAGCVSTQAGTTYPFVATDCNTTVKFTAGTAVAATLPNNLAIGCTIAAVQMGAGQVTFTAAAGATGPLNRSSFTKTAGQYAGVGLSVLANSTGTAAQWVLFGDGQ